MKVSRMPSALTKCLEGSKCFFGWECESRLKSFPMMNKLEKRALQVLSQAFIFFFYFTLNLANCVWLFLCSCLGARLPSITGDCGALVSWRSGRHIGGIQSYGYSNKEKINMDELRAGLHKIGQQITDADLQILMNAVSIIFSIFFLQ